MDKSMDKTMMLDRPSWPSRRVWLTSVGLCAFGAPVLWSRFSHGTGATRDEIAQPIEPGPEAFMDRAFDMRRRAQASGDQAYGAAVVKDGRLVGQAPSRVIVNGDPTAHAEMEAIRDAAHRLGSRDLSSCVMYSSSRPCPMCEAAAYWAGVERLYFGHDSADGGRPSLSRC